MATDLYIMQGVLRRIAQGVTVLDSDSQNEWKKKLRRVAMELGRHPDSVFDLVNEIQIAVELIRTADEQLGLAKGFDPERPFHVFLVGHELLKWLAGSRDELKTWSVRSFERQISIDELKDVLRIHKELRRVLLLIEQVPELAAEIFETATANHSAETRFRIPMRDLIRTGESIFIVGEAGSGKTTCLQMFADSMGTALGRGDSVPLTIFVPLGRVVVAKEVPKSTPSRTRISQLLLSHLRSTGLSDASAGQVENLLDAGCVLLLDGIDEAIRNSPWILDVFTELNTRYPAVQVVTTSRTMAETIPHLPFTTVSLLPFDEGQQKAFVERWLSRKPVEQAKVLKHLENHREMREIARNPLLATVLCELAQDGRDLPESELQLYEDRFELLTGMYDSFKRISARVRQRRSNLRIVAQKTAIYLHRRAFRQLLQEEIARGIESDLALSPEDIRECLDELRLYCEILVPMGYDGSIGFGHMRFQEHLVASELRSMQWGEVYELLDDSRWTDVIYLYLCNTATSAGFVKFCLERGGKSSVQWARLHEIVGKLPMTCRAQLVHLFETKKHVPKLPAEYVSLVKETAADS